MSSQQASGVGISVGLGLLSGGLGAAVAGADILLGAAVGGALGGVSGGLGVLLAPKPGDQANNGQGLLETTAIRDLPVPVIFGTARVSGNWIALGNFFRYKDAFDGTPGVRLRQIHAVLALAEGPIQAVGNFYLDGKTIQQQEQETELPESRFLLQPVLGTATQRIPNWLATAENRQAYGFEAIADPTGWRHTAYLLVAVNVGQSARFPEIRADVTGPDYAIRRKGNTGQSASPQDQVRRCFYDGASEAFYAVLSSSGARASPLGLVKTPREKGADSHTPPPASVTADIQRGWYLGKHDLLVLQDPADCARFHIGYWGIDPASCDWEQVAPDGGYARPMVGEHLDELNGALHSLHQGDGAYYILRWNLLSGRITRLAISTQLEPSAITAFMYCPDRDAYILATADARLLFVEAQTGRVYHTARRVHTKKATGLCAAGALVGVISASGISYYDPARGQSLNRKGSGDVGLEPGCLGGITSACQNTWTGHVTVWKPSSSFPASAASSGNSAPATATLSAAAYINFIPSMVEFNRLKEKDINIFGWCRDWSTRQFDRYELVALEGRSSIAAAMWSLLVDEAGSGRWGAGLDRDLVCLSSFESVHAYAVGPVRYPHKQSMPYAERFQFDYALSGERTVADLLAGEMLLSINGYRTLVDGKLHVGVQRGGLGLCWHFTEHQIQVDSARLAFLGRPAGVNRARVSFADRAADGRDAVAEANDEFDQLSRGRVTSATLAPGGVVRLGQAQHLAQQVIDASASNRRQITFKTNWIAFALTCGDGIELSSPSLGLTRLRARVTAITENESNEIEITAVEHQPVREAVLPQAGAGDGDSADCQRLALSAEYRRGIPMMPMHAAVYEDPALPQLIPLAGLSPKSRLASRLRVDYRRDDAADWSSLGTIDSSFGGYLSRNLTISSRSLVLEGLHGQLETLDGDLPVVLSAHEYLGPQSPRPGSGDEVVLATGCAAAAARTLSLALHRDQKQVWAAATTGIAHLYRVHAVAEDDGCLAPSLYQQASDACTGERLELFVKMDDIDEYPFYFSAAGRQGVIQQSAIVTDEPGTICSDWTALDPGDRACAPMDAVELEFVNGEDPTAFEYYNRVGFAQMPVATMTEAGLIDVGALAATTAKSPAAAAAAAAAAQAAGAKMMYFDIEDANYPEDIRAPGVSLAQVQASVAAYISWVDAAHAAAPGLLVGFYSVGVIDDWFSPCLYAAALAGAATGNSAWIGNLPQYAARYQAWQAANDVWAGLLAKVDVLMPSFYAPYANSSSDWQVFAQGVLDECARLAPGKPVVPFLWWKVDQGADYNQYLGDSFWGDILAWTYAHVKKLILWGYEVPAAFDPAAPWWLVVRDFVQGHRGVYANLPFTIYGAFEPGFADGLIAAATQSILLLTTRQAIPKLSHGERIFLSVNGVRRSFASGNAALGVDLAQAQIESLAVAKGDRIQFLVSANGAAPAPLPIDNARAAGTRLGAAVRSLPPWKMQLTVAGDSGGCGPAGTYLLYRQDLGGGNYLYHELVNYTQKWAIGRVADAAGNVDHWQLVPISHPACVFRLPGSEGLAHPQGAWTIGGPGEGTGCSCTSSALALSITVLE